MKKDGIKNKIRIDYSIELKTVILTKIAPSDEKKHRC